MKTHIKTDNRLAGVRPWMATLLFAGACATEPLPDQPEPDTTETATLTATSSLRPTLSPTLAPRPLPPPLPPPPDPVAPTVLALERGTGWKRVQVSGSAEDLATGTTQTLGSEFYVIDGRASINNTSLPANTRAVLTGQLATIPLPTDGDDEIIIVPKGLNDAIQAQANGAEVIAFCDDSTKVFGKTYGFDRSKDYHLNSEPGALVGSGRLPRPAQGLDARRGEVLDPVRLVLAHVRLPPAHGHRLGRRAGHRVAGGAVPEAMVLQHQDRRADAGDGFAVRNPDHLHAADPGSASTRRPRRR